MSCHLCVVVNVDAGPQKLVDTSIALFAVVPFHCLSQLIPSEGGLMSAVSLLSPNFDV